MFSRQRRKARFLFGLSDILLIALAFEAAYRTRSLLHLERIFYIIVPSQALILGFAMASWVLSGLWLGVYDRLDAGDPRVILRDSFRQSAYAAVTLILFEFSLRLDLSRSFLALFIVYAWTLLFLFRLFSGRMAGAIRREFGGPHFVMVAGTGERARKLGEALERSAAYGIRLTGFLAAEPGAAPAEIRLESTYKVYPIGELRQLLCDRVIDEIIFSVGSETLGQLEEVFLLCDEEGVRTRVAVDFFPHVNSEVYLERLGFTPLLTFSAAPHDEIRLLVKRGTDVAIAAAGLVVLLPCMAGRGGDGAAHFAGAGDLQAGALRV